MIKLLVILSIIFSAPAWAATYHVRTDGHDTNCNGSADASAASAPNCAFLTVVKGVSTATTAGDILNVHTGDYSGEGAITSQAAGSSGSIITIQGHDTDVVTLSRIVVDHEYNKWDKFTLANPGNSCDGSSAAIRVLKPNTTISNMKATGHDVSNCLSECPIGVLIEGTSALTTIIENNTFDGGYWFIVFAFHRPATVQNNIIRNVIDVERIFDVLFTSSSVTDATIITGNEIHSYTSPGTKCSNHPDIFQVVDQGGTSSALNWVITNNYFHDCQSSIGINEAAAVSTGWIFRNNVFANIRDQMSLLTENTKVQNNTFFQVALTQAGVMDCSYDSVEIRNNVIIGANATSTQGMINIQNEATPTLGYNFFSLPKANSYGARDSGAYDAIKGTGSINGGDPKLVAVYDDCVANECNFNILVDSPLKDVGATLTGFSTDKNGVTRPQGAAWDIGAYEYNGLGSTNQISIGSGVSIGSGITF